MNTNSKRRAEAESRSGIIDDTLVFDMLSSERRRAVVRQLKDHSSTVEFQWLTEVVSAAENGVPVDEVTHEQRKRVYVALRQVHLPKLHDTSFVVYDQEQGVITPTERLAALAVPLNAVDESPIVRVETFQPVVTQQPDGIEPAVQPEGQDQLPPGSEAAED